MIEYIILVAVIAAGVMGIIITKNMFGSNEIHGKLKNRYLEYIDSLEKDNKKLTGKLNKMKQGVSISKDDFDFVSQAYCAPDRIISTPRQSVASFLSIVYCRAQGPSLWLGKSASKKACGVARNQNDPEFNTTPAPYL